MDTILSMIARGFQQLIERADGPLHFRLIVMPTVVTTLAILSDRRDAHEGRPAPLGAFFRDSVERRRLLRIAFKDVGRVLIVATVMDTAYQLWVFRWIYPVQLVIVVVACAIVPYVLVRGPIIRLIRLAFGRRGQGAQQPKGRSET